jgi:hypothetical protein
MMSYRSRHKALNTRPFALHKKVDLIHALDLRSVRVCVYIDDRIIRSAKPDCAPTVHEWNVFNPFGLALSEKQIPRFVENARS